MSNPNVGGWIARKFSKAAHIVTHDLPHLGVTAVKDIINTPAAILSDSRAKISAENLAYMRSAANEALPVSFRIEMQDELIRIGDWTNETLQNHLVLVARHAVDPMIPVSVQNYYVEELALRGVSLTAQ